MIVLGAWATPPVDASGLRNALQVAADYWTAVGGNSVAFTVNPTLTVTVSFQSSCGYAGQGWIGRDNFTLNGYTDKSTIAHEYGHSLGLNHANRVSALADLPSSSCVVSSLD